MVSEGRAAGWEDGQTVGHADGWEEGMDVGFERGFEMGFEQGREAGLAAGGRFEAYHRGFENGQNDEIRKAEAMALRGHKR